jgi:exodeoxyribonuclease III
MTRRSMELADRAGASESASGAGRLTIVSWNIENLAGYIQGPGEPGLAPSPSQARRRSRATMAVALPSLAEIVAKLGAPDVLCLQEIRIRPQDHALIASARAALPGYECQLSLNRDPENARFRGGRAYGVATYVRRSLRADHSVLDWDREGRVLITTLAAERFAIANVYAVNGTAKPYYDHELGRVQGDRHAFKRSFNRRLMHACAELRQQGLQLVLIGDWNISRATIDTYPRLRTEEPHALARRLFNEKFIPGLQVVDAFRHLHPLVRKYSWFARSSSSGRLDAARVDLGLLSETLLPRLMSADILDDQSLGFGSDHAPLRVELRVAGTTR